MHVHNNHSLAKTHLLISTKKNNFRPPAQFSTFLTGIFSYQSSATKSQFFKFNLQPPEEPEHQQNSSISMTVPVSLSFRLLAAETSLEVLNRLLLSKARELLIYALYEKCKSKRKTLSKSSRVK